jgi:hypothetical protein
MRSTVCSGELLSKNFRQIPAVGGSPCVDLGAAVGVDQDGHSAAGGEGGGQGTCQAAAGLVGCGGRWRSPRAVLLAVCAFFTLNRVAVESTRLSTRDRGNRVPVSRRENYGLVKGNPDYRGRELPSAGLVDRPGQVGFPASTSCSGT